MTQRPKVLYVEDDEDARELLVLWLRRDDLDARGVGNVADGMEALARESFDALIVDYNLPDGTGTALVREARRRGLLGDASVFLCTAMEYPECDAGMDLFHKPIELRGFLRALRAAIVASSTTLHS